MKLLLQAFIRAHVLVYRLSNGRFGANMGGGQVALLTTIGRKTGKARTVPVAAFEDQGDIIVVASYAGAPNNPAWFNNLSVNPDVAVQLGSASFRARAEVLDEEARERAWRMVLDRAPGFGKYQQKTTRKIPLVRLKRRPT